MHLTRTQHRYDQIQSISRCQIVVVVAVEVVDERGGVEIYSSPEPSSTKPIMNAADYEQIIKQKVKK